MELEGRYDDDWRARSDAAGSQQRGKKRAGSRCFENESRECQSSKENKITWDWLPGDGWMGGWVGPKRRSEEGLTQDLSKAKLFEGSRQTAMQLCLSGLYVISS